MFKLLALVSIALLAPGQCFFGGPAANARISQGPKSAEAVVDKLLSPQNKAKTMVVLGTYAADFNAIEYGQRLRHYLPELKSKGVKKIAMVLNAEESSCEAFRDILNLPPEIELLADPLGETGRKYGVSRGLLPDVNLNPFLKLYIMLFGAGAPNTLPAVITGYLGNPNGESGWITSSLAQGQIAGRWPNNALKIDDSGNVETNFFAELPVVGSWGRRPLELATLRLQNMIGVSLNRWEDLAPKEASLQAGVLTQLGGCIVVSNGERVYERMDDGICSIADFEEILRAL
uniref:Uncharacterized protein n=1 Tax=Fibrocapsa japonica TaxID=94617 RepID=A0A7S2V3W9_9STRA|mmetsp:Transcript_5091/g.7756  ORF Transcript_5091/g.7756 Transcript_5091/m.7756 type:complete len:289 (+) Transcript_5091:112-978(+)